MITHVIFIIRLRKMNVAYSDENSLLFTVTNEIKCKSTRYCLFYYRSEILNNQES